MHKVIVDIVGSAGGAVARQKAVESSAHLHEACGNLVARQNLVAQTQALKRKLPQSSLPG